jgi:ribosomal 30S subunit maturation factor RimM
MQRYVAGAAAALALALGLPALAGDQVIVLDAPDLRKLDRDQRGFLRTEIVGTDVYGNGGKRIGEVKDFVVTRGGYLYAVVDTKEGALDGALDLSDGEDVVVPWDELRMSAVPE